MLTAPRLRASLVRGKPTAGDSLPRDLVLVRGSEARLAGVGGSRTICISSQSIQGIQTVFTGCYYGRICLMGPLLLSYKHKETGLRQKNQDNEGG